MCTILLCISNTPPPMDQNVFDESANVLLYSSDEDRLLIEVLCFLLNYFFMDNILPYFSFDSYRKMTIFVNLLNSFADLIYDALDCNRFLVRSVNQT